MSDVTRRQFVQATGAALAAAGLTATAADAPARKRPIKKAFMGIFSPQPKRELSLVDKFKMLRDAGFEGVEVPSGMNHDEVLKARDAAGLAIPSVVVSSHWQKPMSSPDPAVREATVESLKT